MSGEPFIESAELLAGHDGRTEVVLRVVYPNGGRSPVRLDAEEAFHVLEANGAKSLDELTGRPWRALFVKETKCSISRSGTG